MDGGGDSVAFAASFTRRFPANMRMEPTGLVAVFMRLRSSASLPRRLVPALNPPAAHPRAVRPLCAWR